jgi:TonB family protein
VRNYLPLLNGLLACAVFLVVGCAENRSSTPLASDATQLTSCSTQDSNEPLLKPRALEEWERDQDRELARLLQDLEGQRKRLQTAEQELWRAVGKSRPTLSGQQPAPEPNAYGQSNYTWLAEDLSARIAQFLWYPEAARVNRWEGRVVVHLLFRENGEFVTARVAKSSGYKLLDANAIDVVRRTCSLKLRQRLDKPVVLVSVPVIYKLE